MSNEIELTEEQALFECICDGYERRINRQMITIKELETRLKEAEDAIDEVIDVCGTDNSLAILGVYRSKFPKETR